MIQDSDIIRHELYLRKQVGGHKDCAVVFLRQGTDPVSYTHLDVYKRQLQSNDRFDHTKATAELGFKPRDLFQTIADTITWMKKKSHSILF